MSQPVKLSDALVLDARLADGAVERSIPGQVAFWATAHRLSDCLASIDSPGGRRRVADFLQTQPYPHYEPHPDKAGLLIRIEANGKRTLGRFVNRQFHQVKIKSARR